MEIKKELSFDSSFYKNIPISFKFFRKIKKRLSFDNLFFITEMEGFEQAHLET